jgi:hypothetical protein
MSDPRFFKCDGRTYDEKAKNPLKRVVRDAYDSITGAGTSFALRRVKTDFDITQKRFAASAKGRLVDTSGETNLNIKFDLDLVARGRAILAKKGKKTAKEFNARRLKGIISFREPSLESLSGSDAVAFNLRTIVPIKMCKDVFKGDFGTTFAKIDFERSRFTGQGFFSGVSSTQVASAFGGGNGAGFALDNLTNSLI